jgi:DNA polymerase-3 subunit delta'
VTAQAINYQLIDNKNISVENKTIKHFSQLLQAITLFNRLDRINVIMRKINHNINMNQTLVLENLLLGYLEATFPRGL